MTHLMNNAGAYVSILLMVLAITALSFFSRKRTPEPARRAVKCKHLLRDALEYTDSDDYCTNCLFEESADCSLCRDVIVRGEPIAVRHAPKEEVPKEATLFRNDPSFFITCGKDECIGDAKTRGVWEIGPDGVGYPKID